MSDDKYMKEEVKGRIEGCPWRDGDCCSRYEGCKIPCDGACSWVVDYVKFKEIKSKYKIN